jgi:4-hydroxy-3-methylbut-2-enyl diphosphate reductase
LVTKVHIEVTKYRKQQLEILLIGHAGHPEVEGTMGQASGGIHLIEKIEDVEMLEVSNPDKLAYVSQTTLSMDDTAKIVDALRARFPNINGPKKDDICYATQNRQDAVKKLVEKCDIVFVVGSPNSSNSNRLREIAELRNVPAYLIDGPDEICEKWLEGKTRAGVTAGASAPESLVAQVVTRLNSTDTSTVELDGPPENISFSLPSALRN